MIILKRQLYSYIEPEQREYNIISDLYHSGIKRTYKKNVGRIRRKVGDKLNKLKEETKSKYYEVVKKADYLDSKVPENKELLENLKDKIKSRGIDVFENDEVSKIYVKDSVGKNRTYIFRPSDKRIERAKQLVTEEKFKKDPNFKVIESIAKGRPVINLQGDNKAGKLAHEVGHKINEENFITRFIYNKEHKYKNKDNLSSKIKRRIVAPMNESNATRNGLKLLKESGASKEELKAIKEAAKESINTYKLAGNYRILDRLENKIQIPSKLKNKGGRNGKK